MKKIVITIIFGLIVSGLLMPTAFAQVTKKPAIIPEGTNDNLLIPHTAKGTNEDANIMGNLLPSATKTVIAVAGGLAFLFIIIGGIQILTAYGNDEQIGTAKKTIQYAIVGLLIALLSYAIVSIISSINLGK